MFAGAEGTRSAPIVTWLNTAAGNTRLLIGNQGTKISAQSYYAQKKNLVKTISLKVN